MIVEKEMPTLENSSLALYHTAEILQRLGIPFILDGGTLLGFYRDGFFAADDHDDIDLTTVAEAWNRAGEICEAMKLQGFEVYHEWPRKEGRSAQLAFKRDNVKVDLMFKEKTGNYVWWTIYGGPNGVTYKAVPKHLLESARLLKIRLPLGQNIVDEIGVGMPEGVEDYLSFRYGEWQTPVHRKDYSCYNTDKCIITKDQHARL